MLLLKGSSIVSDEFYKFIKFDIQLYSGSAKQVLKANIPHNFSSENILCQMLRYPKKIDLEFIRNDFYVILKEGNFLRGLKTADKNVMVNVQVIDENMNVIPVIFQYHLQRCIRLRFRPSVKF